MDVGRLVSRAVIGGVFIGHGTQKLFGWFDGPGPAGTAAMMESLDLRPGKVHAVLSGVTETVGGSLLAAGLATPLASAALTGIMTTAIKKVHIPNGPWAVNGGWEYPAVMIGSVTALAEAGPGDLSLDHALGTERSGPLWALAALATGVGAAALTMAVGRRGPSSLPPTGTSATTAAQGDIVGGQGSPPGQRPLDAA
jgi:putative oxidoreductase